MKFLYEVEFMKDDFTGKLYTRRFSRDDIDPVTNTSREVVYFDINGYPGSGKFSVQYRVGTSGNNWKRLGCFKSVQAAKKAILEIDVVGL